MPEYRFTDYFEREVLRKRSYLKKEWCIRVVEAPLKTESQENNRYRFWGSIEELGGRIQVSARGPPPPAGRSGWNA